MCFVVVSGFPINSYSCNKSLTHFEADMEQLALFPLLVLSQFRQSRFNLTLCSPHQKNRPRLCLLTLTSSLLTSVMCSESTPVLLYLHGCTVKMWVSHCFHWWSDVGRFNVRSPNMYSCPACEDPTTPTPSVHLCHHNPRFITSCL